ncbi:MAG: sigma-70 family RNA polymerase sigma factor, partial [Planctomycetota bacterium]
MDTPLLAQIAAGRAGAVEDFLRQHGNSVWGLARRFCRSAEDAEDATQEILVEIWRNAARYDQNAGSELTFVMTIARRRLIDRTRRLGRRPSFELLAEASDLPAEPPKVDAAEFDDEVRRAQAAMQQLRPEQQRVLELALTEGRTHHEIAVAIGIPLGTVKSHARRGLIRLRALLGVKAPVEDSRSDD